MLPVSDFKYNASRRSINTVLNKPSAVGFIPNWQSIGKVKIKFLLALAVILFSLFGIQLAFASNLSTDGHKLASIENDIQKQETQNLKLRTKIAQISSLSSLSEKASELGFVKPQKIITP